MQVWSGVDAGLASSEVDAGLRVGQMLGDEIGLVNARQGMSGCRTSVWSGWNKLDKEWDVSKIEG